MSFFHDDFLATPRHDISADWRELLDELLAKGAMSLLGTAGRTFFTLAPDTLQGIRAMIQEISCAPPGGISGYFDGDFDALSHHWLPRKAA